MREARMRLQNTPDSEEIKKQIPVQRIDINTARAQYQKRFTNRNLVPRVDQVESLEL